MTSGHEAIREGGHDPFSTGVSLRRDPEDGRRDQTDAERSTRLAVVVDVPGRVVKVGRGEGGWTVHGHGLSWVHHVL